MTRHHDVHVFPNVLHGGWKVTQGKRVLANHCSWERAMAVGIRRVRRDQVDLVAHGPFDSGRWIRRPRSWEAQREDPIEGQLRNESTTRDTEH
jgi:hypothetical protein